MPETLIDDLKAVESIPHYFNFDKRDGYRKVFEIWSSVSPLVKEAISGRVSIYEKYDRLERKYGGIRRHYPNVVSDEDLRDIQELVKIFGYTPISKDGAMFINPIFLGGGAGIIGGLTEAGLESNNLVKKKISRREFLKTTGKIAAFSAIIGGALSEACIVGDTRAMNSARENAIYVEEKIKELYLEKTP